MSIFSDLFGNQKRSFQDLRKRLQGPRPGRQALALGAGKPRLGRPRDGRSLGPTDCLHLGQWLGGTAPRVVEFEAEKPWEQDGTRMMGWKNWNFWEKKRFFFFLTINNGGLTWFNHQHYGFKSSERFNDTKWGWTIKNDTKFGDSCHFPALNGWMKHGLLENPAFTDDFFS